MSWDFARLTPSARIRCSFGVSVENILRSRWTQQSLVRAVHIFQVDAPANAYPIRPVAISTDPPYYDNIGYADLSDFFYVWLRRSLSDDLAGRCSGAFETPKHEELVATPYRFGGKDAAEAHFHGRNGPRAGGDARGERSLTRRSRSTTRSSSRRSPKTVSARQAGLRSFRRW